MVTLTTHRPRSSRGHSVGASHSREGAPSPREGAPSPSLHRHDLGPRHPDRPWDPLSDLELLLRKTTTVRPGTLSPAVSLGVGAEDPQPCLVRRISPMTGFSGRYLGTYLNLSGVLCLPEVRQTGVAQGCGRSGPRPGGSHAAVAVAEEQLGSSTRVGTPPASCPRR